MLPILTLSWRCVPPQLAPRPATDLLEKAPTVANVLPTANRASHIRIPQVIDKSTTNIDRITDKPVSIPCKALGQI